MINAKFADVRTSEVGKTWVQVIVQESETLCGNGLLQNMQLSYDSTYFHNVYFKNMTAEKKYILIRSNKMQQYAGINLVQNHSPRVSCVHRTHHQDNIKL